MAEFVGYKTKDSTSAAASATAAFGSSSSRSAFDLSLSLNFVDFRTEEVLDGLSKKGFAQFTETPLYKGKGKEFVAQGHSLTPAFLQGGCFHNLNP